MITRLTENIQLLQFENLTKHMNLNHFTTTRTGGVSKGLLKGLNIGFTVGDNPIFVSQNREILAKAKGIEQTQFVFPKQNHGANIGIVKSTHDLFPDTDALITNIPGIYICIQTADCVPILLYDPVHNVIAAIHSGWRGTVLKISMKTIELMKKNFGTKAKDILAGIGPSIGPDVYEIGSDVIHAITQSFDNTDFLKPTVNPQKAILDLWIANKFVLTESGVHESNIEISELCTYSNPQLFFSARRDGVKCGRLASGIMMKV